MIRYLQPVVLRHGEVVELHHGDRVEATVYAQGKWRVLINRRSVTRE